MTTKKQPTVKDENMIPVKELYTVLDGLKKCGKYSNPEKFRYGVAKNLRLIKEGIADIEDPLSTPPEKISEYNKAFVALEESLAAKNGPKIKRLPQTSVQIKRNEPGDIVFNDEAKAEIEFRKLKSKYKSDIDDWEERGEKLNEFINKEKIPWEYHKIDLDEIPEELSAELLEAIWPVINDTTEQ